MFTVAIVLAVWWLLVYVSLVGIGYRTDTWTGPSWIFCAMWPVVLPIGGICYVAHYCISKDFRAKHAEARAKRKNKPSQSD